MARRDLRCLQPRVAGQRERMCCLLLFFGSEPSDFRLRQMPCLPHRRSDRLQVSYGDGQSRNETPNPLLCHFGTSPLPKSFTVVPFTFLGSFDTPLCTSATSWS